MRIVKIIVGLGCFVAALLPGGLALLGLSNLGTAETLPNFCFASALAVLAIGLVRAGWFLIARRNLPMSRKARVLITLIICLFTGFVVAFVIPGFIAARLVRSANACVNNLRQIDGAKQQWALENNKHSNDIPTGAEISVYLWHDKMLVCPQGGTYTIGRVDEDPKCSVSTSAWPNDHVLNPTNSWWTHFKAAYSTVLGLRHVQP